ncbi:hypothetical protein CBM2599_A40352 [Cupriavidus taiwanensis]|uniref:Uncharacterized protein n=1 Tax=Cupriavidus taiwanensis TaxID=164546 RepID=A0A976AKD1_9BURK|nr:hypothetical protein CBM2599_A40352 [Cupriavidus taiwanensis]SOY90236.1 hypothetical protein CBM2600_A50354 [Cupriavidus taiwanensis]SPD63740.1 protein of unknown function [Cupriavidus taiwanensis]
MRPGRGRAAHPDRNRVAAAPADAAREEYLIPPIAPTGHGQPHLSTRSPSCRSENNWPMPGLPSLPTATPRSSLRPRPRPYRAATISSSATCTRPC